MAALANIYHTPIYIYHIPISDWLWIILSCIEFVNNKYCTEKKYLYIPQSIDTTIILQKWLTHRAEGQKMPTLHFFCTLYFAVHLSLRVLSISELNCRAGWAHADPNTLKQHD